MRLHDFIGFYVADPGGNVGRVTRVTADGRKFVVRMNGKLTGAKNRFQVYRPTQVRLTHESRRRLAREGRSALRSEEAENV